MNFNSIFRVFQLSGPWEDVKGRHKLPDIARDHASVYLVFPEDLISINSACWIPQRNPS